MDEALQLIRVIRDDPWWQEEVRRETEKDFPAQEDFELFLVTGRSSINSEQIIAVLRVICKAAGILCPLVGE